MSATADDTKNRVWPTTRSGRVAAAARSAPPKPRESASGTGKFGMTSRAGYRNDHGARRIAFPARRSPRQVRREDRDRLHAAGRPQGVGELLHVRLDATDVGPVVRAVHEMEMRLKEMREF
jgi:hypothetical protein